MEASRAPTATQSASTGASLSLVDPTTPAVAPRPGAYRQGYPEDYWTLERITHLIWDLFRVAYNPTGAWRLLQRLGWSCQKPQRRALHRDDEAIAHWKHSIWPQIRKVAAT